MADALPSLTPFPWGDLAIIVALIALNGVFAMSELAIVSARRARLDAITRKSQLKGAQTAIALASDPGRFLSTVQIGITLIGIIAGAYSGASLSGQVAERLVLLGLPVTWADDVGFGLVIGLTTFASLIIGELVPKQFALRAPEPIAVVMAVPMVMLARITAPIVWLLDRTSALIFRLLGLNRESDSHVTAEELHLIVAEASKSGIIEESERAIISGVVRLADRPVREVMTPRTEIDWIDEKADAKAIHQAVLASPHSRLLVARGSVDEIVGVVGARDLLAARIERHRRADVEQHVQRGQVVRRAHQRHIEPLRPGAALAGLQPPRVALRLVGLEHLLQLVRELALHHHLPLPQAVELRQVLEVNRACHFAVAAGGAGPERVGADRTAD